MRTLADRINWIQGHLGARRISLAALAKKAGLTRQGLSRLKRAGEKPTEKPLGEAATIKALAAAAGVDINWLMTGEGVPRKGKLSALETVLAERDWPEPAKAAALAEKQDYSAEEWRSLLTRVAAAFESLRPSQNKNRKPLSHRES